MCSSTVRLCCQWSCWPHVHFSRQHIPSLIFSFMISTYFTGFNVETVEYKNISFTVWDVGGQDKARTLITFSFCNFTFGK